MRIESAAPINSDARGTIVPLHPIVPPLIRHRIYIYTTITRGFDVKSRSYIYLFFFCFGPIGNLLFLSIKYKLKSLGPSAFLINQYNVVSAVVVSLVYFYFFIIIHIYTCFTYTHIHTYTCTYLYIVHDDGMRGR